MLIFQEKASFKPIQNRKTGEITAFQMRRNMAQTDNQTTCFEAKVPSIFSDKAKVVSIR